MNTEQPTEQEINRRIAEWMGWKQGHSITGTDGCTKYYDWGWTPPAGSKAKLGIEECPSFTTSHDACHQALERMTDPQFCEWHEVLLDLVGVKDESDENQSVLLVRRVMAATAHQKALAIYNTIKQ